MMTSKRLNKGLSFALATVLTVGFTPLAFSEGEDLVGQASGTTCPTSTCPSGMMQHQPGMMMNVQPQACPTSRQTQGQRVIIPAGSKLTVQPTGLTPTRAGTVYTGQVVNPVLVDGVTIIPSGSLVRGEVLSVNPNANTMDVQFTEVSMPTGEMIPIRARSTVPSLQGAVVSQGQGPSGISTFYPRVSFGPQRLSGPGKVAMGTLGGATFGAATGTLTGLTMAATSDTGISNGSGAVRGLGWGAAYGGGLGLLGGLIAAASDRSRVATTTACKTYPRGLTNISSGSYSEVPVSYPTPGVPITPGIMQNNFDIFLEQPATVTI